MSGLTNYTRHRVLGSIAGVADLQTVVTWVGLLTAPPSTDGGVNGGVLDAVEMIAPRKVVLRENILPLVEPRWSRGAGDFGGWQMVNIGDLEWSEADMASLPESVTLVAGALYDAEVGGNMIAWDYLDDEVVAVPGIKIVLPSGRLKVRMHKEIVT